MNVKHKTRAHKNFFLAIFFSFYFCAFRSRLRASAVLELLLCEQVVYRYIRPCIDDLLSVCACDDINSGATGSTHSCIAYSATHHLLYGKLSVLVFFPFFPRSLRCRSTRLCLYLGHPMRTVLFLVLDRPAISQLTYQQQQQPASQQRLWLYFISPVYTRTHFSRRAFATMSDEPWNVHNAKSSLFSATFFSFWCSPRKKNGLPYIFVFRAFSWESI